MRRLRGIILLMSCLAAVCLLSGCGVNHKSPEGVVKSLVKYSEKGKEKKILDCYGLDKKADEATKAEVNSVIQYFKAMKSKDITLTDCDIIQDFGEYIYVYITYQVEFGKSKEYPKIDTYLVGKKGKKDYYVIPTKDVTAEMSAAAETAYADFMTTEPYKEYQKAYDKFILKNPNFEEELSIKLNQA